MLVTDDVSEWYIDPTFKGQAVFFNSSRRDQCCPETSVTNYQPTLCNIPEERRPQTEPLNPLAKQTEGVCQLPEQYATDKLHYQLSKIKNS